MTKKEKTKLIVWSCIGVAVLAAILLFFFMPRRGDKLLRLPDAESVYGLYMVDSTVTPYGSSHFYEVNSTTTNTRLVQEYYDFWPVRSCTLSTPPAASSITPTSRTPVSCSSSTSGVTMR